ncbi:MAG: triose-phosphate isomerase [Bacteriovoracia bacterium]
MSRKIYMVGNWKMNQKLEEIRNFFDNVKEIRSDMKCECWIAPQYIHIPIIQEMANVRDKIKVGAQNCANHEKGAYTGEVSPIALKDLNVHFTIIGHSERRSIYKEEDKLLNEKTKLALETGLNVIFCVGETLEEREEGNTMKVVKAQIIKGLEDLPSKYLSNLVVAYEPVWAIGTGKTATPDQAQEVHAYIREEMKELFGADGQNVSILYGGSVKPGNVAELLDQPDIDGGLVGGASLKPDNYVALCKVADEKSS